MSVPLPPALPNFMKVTIQKFEEPVSCEDEVVKIRKKIVDRGYEILVSCFRPSTPRLQIGPTCGFVALSIALSSLGVCHDFDEILHSAIAKGFSKQGELFSVYNLADLANSCEGVVAEVKQNILLTNIFISFMLKGGIALVPYDTDCNHSPCCKRGSSAHWAVITGLMIIREVESSNPCSMTDMELLNWCLSAPGSVRVLARQGKSKHLHEWGLNELADSNANLVEISPYRNSEDYVFPENGIAQTLKDKVIFVRKQ